jgi:hypothetical protein
MYCERFGVHRSSHKDGGIKFLHKVGKDLQHYTAPQPGDGNLHMHRFEHFSSHYTVMSHVLVLQAKEGETYRAEVTLGGEQKLGRGAWSLLRRDG